MRVTFPSHIGLCTWQTWQRHCCIRAHVTSWSQSSDIVSTICVFLHVLMLFHFTNTTFSAESLIWMSVVLMFCTPLLPQTQTLLQRWSGWCCDHDSCKSWKHPSVQEQGTCSIPPSLKLRGCLVNTVTADLITTSKGAQHGLRMGLNGRRCVDKKWRNCKLYNMVLILSPLKTIKSSSWSWNI